ncbi:MAG: hypothetical protein K2N63_15730, partial [Lachnospiraceae bacterium]|nr:hypothetical protein [Lachnospiraceae bacterium]
AAQCGQIALEITGQQEKLARFDKLLEAQEELDRQEKEIGRKRESIKAFEEEKKGLETALQADSRELKELAGEGEKKERLENSREKIQQQIECLKAQTSAWELEGKRQEEAEQSQKGEEEYAATLTEEITRQKESILALADQDAALLMAEELSGKLVGQDEVLRQVQKELLEKQEQLQQTGTKMEELYRQEALLCEAQKKCKSELERLKDADGLEIRQRHKTEAAKEALCVFMEQKDSLDILNRRKKEAEEVYQKALKRAEENRKQQERLRSEWEEIKDVDTRRLQLTQEQKVLADQKKDC